MKKLITSKDFIIIAAALLLGAALFLARGFSSQGETVVVKYNGEVEKTFPLNGEYYEITVNSVVIRRENNEVYVADSDCEDKTCVRSGKLSKKGDAAFCVPNRVSVEIEGKGANSPDAMTW